MYEIAAHLGIIASIQKAAPTDGLWGDERSDADQIGASYPELEWAMELRGGKALTQSGSMSDRQREVLRIFDRRRKANLHKMVPIPICEVPDSLR